MGILFLENCCPVGEDCYEDCCFSEYKEWGYKAVYSNELNDIVSLEAPRTVSSPGKIYLYKDYLLVNEVQRGMHIIDNTDPRQPKNIHFLRIEGSNDVAIKNDVLYADQFNNLITVNLDSLTNELEKNRLENVFENYAYYDARPDSTGVYYECPDPYFGVVVDWVQDSVSYPCYSY